MPGRAEKAAENPAFGDPPNATLVAPDTLVDSDARISAIVSWKIVAAPHAAPKPIAHVGIPPFVALAEIQGEACRERWRREEEAQNAILLSGYGGEGFMHAHAPGDP